MARQCRLKVLPIWLDQQNRRVWQGPERLLLRPQEFDVLHYLISHAGMVVTKDALFKAVWQKDNPTYAASDEVITTCIYSLRRKLKDTGKPPRYVETTYKQGYRFIGPVAARAPDSPVTSLSVSEASPEPAPLRPSPAVVGREEELASLHHFFEAAKTGERQVVFVTGEPGIGKTSLVRVFLGQVAMTGQAIVGRGQCVERYGPGEAYMPVLEALSRMCREPGGNAIIEWMEQHVPTWLVQMPSLIGGDKMEALQRRVQGATRERMLREMREGLEELTKHKPLVLVLEDLHWSDISTLDLLRSLGQEQGQARVLIIGTYRPHEGLAERRPLRALTQELYGHGQSTEIALSVLPKTAVEQYVRMRFPENVLPTHFASMLHQLTDGNPFFLVALLDDLIRRGAVAQVDGYWMLQREIESLAAEVPENVRQLIGRQIDRLKGAEQRILAAASMVGLQFSAAAVAAAAEMPTADVETACMTLARRQLFLQPAGISEWPDGTVAGCYRFRHALYQYLWSERVTPSQLQQFHRHIGGRLEQAYGKHSGEIAAELALHFEQGREYERAVHYLQQAAATAMQRSACQEAIGHLARGLDLLQGLPDSTEHARQEIALQIALGAPLIVTKGYANPQVEKAYTRARHLCQQTGDARQLFAALWGLSTVYTVRAELCTAWRLAEQLLHLAQRSQDPSLLIIARLALGGNLLWLGQFPAAREHLEAGLALYQPEHHHALAFSYGYDPGIACYSYLSLALWQLGYPEQALGRVREALTLVQRLPHAYSLAHTLAWAAVLHQYRRESELVQEHARATIALSHDQGFPLWATLGTVLQAWALTEQDQVEESQRQLRQAPFVWQLAQGGWGGPYYPTLLAETYRQLGRGDEAAALLTHGLTTIASSGEQIHEAELYRLKGALLLQSSPIQNNSPKSQTKGKTTASLPVTSSRRAEAEEYFLKAIAIARQQHARSWELRAVMSLCRLWREQGKKKRAKQMLTEIYSWFTEGFDTADLRDANALLHELS